jgi:DNA polymerase III subunit delta
MGDEPYFIDQVTHLLEATVLREDDKAFNQTIVYGKDVSMDDIISLCRQYPMGAEYSLVIVKEAQHLIKEIDLLENYFKQIQPSTILVFNYKGKTLDKRKKVTKLISDKGILIESKKLYDNQIPDWIEKKVKEENLLIEPKAKFLLAEYLGTDLSRIENEINKLKINLAEKAIISCESIEKFIGISKEYNIFELTKAVGKKEKLQSFTIVQKFSENEKDHPMVLVISQLYALFSNVILTHTLKDKSIKNMVALLKINPYFVSDYQVAAQNYPLKKATAIISHLRNADAKKKGLENAESDFNIYKELLFAIFN